MTTGIGAGISAQLGIKAESAYGTPVTVDRFFEFESEGIDIDIAKVDAPLLGGGRFLRNDRVKTYLRGAKGAINWGPVMNKNFGLVFQHMLGQNTVAGRSLSGTANAAVTCTATKLTDTRLTGGSALVVDAWKGATVTCDGKTLLVTSNDANSFTGAAWVVSQPADNQAWSVASLDKTHTCQPDSLALTGKSLTVQIGRPDIAGTIQPFTFEGGKITDWELTCAIDEALKLSTTLDFENVLTGTSLAAASYVATQEMFIFTEGALTVGGTSTKVKKASLKGNNSLNVERRFIGNTKKEPLASGLAEITGSLECEFEDLTAYAAWLAGTQAALVLTFTLSTLIPTTSVAYSLTITIPKIEYTGETPKVGGPDTVMQARPFRCLYDGTNPIVKFEYVTGDAAA